MLRTICRADFSISFEQVAEMFRLIRESGGAGLAAPQVGIDGGGPCAVWDK